MESNGTVLEEVFQDLLNESDTVFIVSHKNPDFDAIGSSVGAWVIANKFKKKAYLVIEEDFEQIEIGSRTILENITSDEKKKKGTNIEIIKPNDIENYSGNNNLLVILDANAAYRICVDVNNPIFNNLVIVDHHEKNASTFNKGYKYINPNKSSTSEIITEVLLRLKTKLCPEYANYLTAGIRLDTKHYTINVGSKTHIMLSKLIEMGASESEVSKMFVERDFERGKARQKLICDNTEKINYNYDIAITANTKEKLLFLPEDLAKVANSLQDYGFNASFAIGYINNNTICVSARSNGSINVEVIMKCLGGGGSITAAATRLNNVSMEEVISMLKKSLIPIFFTDETKKIEHNKKLELTM